MFKLSFIFMTWGLLSKVSLAAEGTQTCGTSFWQCADGTCIYLVGRCDNYPDCSDESDEKGCSSVICKEGQRPCSSGECINARFFCDGIINCKDAGDELASDCQGTNIRKSNTNTSSETSPEQNTTIFSTTSTTTKRQQEQQLTVQPVLKPTTLSITLLPDIIVPVNIPTVKSRDRFYLTQPKYNVPDSTRKRETTTIRNKPHVSTTPYWFNWYKTTYQPTTSRTPCVEVDDRFEFCRKRYRGYYRHPNDCKQYIVCEWGFMYICTCPDLTHWDLGALTCVWENTSPCITGHYKRPIIPDHTTREVTPTRAIVTTTSLPTTIQRSTTSLPDIGPPLIRLRALPATPAWLNKLNVRNLSPQNQSEAPPYQSLLARFFKAMPQETANQGIRLS